MYHYTSDTVMFNLIVSITSTVTMSSVSSGKTEELLW